MGMNQTGDLQASLNTLADIRPRYSSSNVDIDGYTDRQLLSNPVRDRKRACPFVVDIVVTINRAQRDDDDGPQRILANWFISTTHHACLKGPACASDSGEDAAMDLYR